MRGAIAVGVKRLYPALPVVAIAGLLALLPFPTCILRLALGIPCPACGLTRATLALARLDVAAALGWHPLSVPLALVTGGMVAAAFVASDEAWRRLVKVTLGAAGVALVVVWVVRFLGAFGGPVPG